MNDINLRLSRSSVIVIAISVAVLFLIFVLNYLNLKNISSLQDSVHTLTTEDPDVTMLRKSSENLAKAEVYYRMYINSWNDSARISFVGNIDSAMNNLKVVAKLDSQFSNKINSDVNYKLKIYAAIEGLKKISDYFEQPSINITSNTSVTSPMKLKTLELSFFRNNLYKYTDTFKVTGAKKKKGLLGRLADALSNKDNTQFKSEHIKSTPEEKHSSDSTRHSTDSLLNGLARKINRYYENKVNKQLAIRKELTEKETLLAQANLSSLSDIDTKIGELLQESLKQSETQRQNSQMQIEASKASLNKISFFSIVSIIAIIGLLIYNIYRTNKYEEAIINAKLSAEKLAQVKSSFLSNMSHEIRSPLTSIIGFTEQIAQHEKNEEDKKYLNAIKVSSGHLLNTVNDILDFSKLDAGKLRLTKEPFVVKKIIEETAFAFSLEAKKKNISLNVSSTIADDFCVNGDVYRFKQILYNLISNAVKFTDHGHVEILTNTTLSHQNKNATVTVAIKDTGVGIPSNQLDFIFQEFAQATVTKKNDLLRSIKGTGLGLPICKMLAELQGGNIKVESKVGQGSVFTVNIPYEVADIKDVHIHEQHHADPLKAVAHNNSGKRILVVEDNELNIMLISLLLEKMGLSFDVAIEGEQAAEFFKEKKYDLVLTDINLPKFTGIQLTELIRKDADQRKSKMPVVALTADITSEDVESYYAVGITEVLMKPFRENEFRQVVENYINA
ncbi:MAG: response regulator [Bacteroidetes bacterium]|nr:response regulator [Bacteroidota bacterium]